MLGLILFLAGSAFPSNSTTSWMHPESFHLVIGMKRADALAVLSANGQKPEKGGDEDHLIVDYTPTRSLTLEFQRDRLRSIRFEMFMPANQVESAFQEERKFLEESLGAPRAVKSPSMLIYDTTLPNVMVVFTRDSSKGLGTLLVRYFDPVVKSGR